MPPWRSPSGCLMFSRTLRRTCADSRSSSSHSRSSHPSKLRSSGMTGEGSDARSHSSGEWLTTRAARPTTRSSRPQHHGLRLGVEVERLLTVLLAVAAGLPAAERELVVDLRARVDPGVAGLDAGGRLAGAR